jgi:hypothetical protein
MRSFRDVRRALQVVLPDIASSPHRGPSLDLHALPTDPPRLAPCDVIEDARLRQRAVEGAPEVGFAAFLDGVQQTHALTYVDGIPIVAGRVAAVIRKRVDRRMTTWGAGAREALRLYAPRLALTRSYWEALERSGLEIVDTLKDDGEVENLHPLELLRRALQVVKNHRDVLERELADQWCEEAAAPLYADGGLPRGARAPSSEWCVGVVKSHHTLYVAGDALRTMLALPEASRSSIFVVERSRRAHVASWYLRLREGVRGGDPMWGLVRVEVALPSGESDSAALSRRADQVSRWILAERAPLSLPDARWDRMTYGVKDCEEYLRATSG